MKNIILTVGYTITAAAAIFVLWWHMGGFELGEVSMGRFILAFFMDIGAFVFSCYQVVQLGKDKK